MSRVFAYCRVSTLEQTTENQRIEIEAAGFTIKPYRIIEEKISGSVAAGERSGFVRLTDRLGPDDDSYRHEIRQTGKKCNRFRKTVENLASMGVKVHCLALDGVVLTSPAGKMTMQVISAVVEFERDLLIERTHSGITRARDSGKRFGRPPALNEEQKQRVLERIRAGISISADAREFRTSRQTILRVKAKQQISIQ